MSKYTNFPRNTKVKFLASCVLKDKQVEEAYKEYAPTQVFHAKEMKAA